MKYLFKGMSGLTLIELMIAMSILMLLGLFIPNFSQTLERNRQDSSLRNLYQITQYARSIAITKGKVITICGSVNGSECIKDWKNAEVLVFEDANQNRQYDEEEMLYQRRHITSNTIHWRGSNRRYMRYHPQGYLLDWGRYTYCPSNKNIQQAKQLVFNRLGRAYQYTANQRELSEKSLCTG